MADKDRDGPSLTLSSFGIGRKAKRTHEKAEPAPHPAPALAEPTHTPPARPTSEPTAERPTPEKTRSVDPVARPPTGAASAPPPRANPGRQPRTAPLFGLGAFPGALVTGVVVGLVTALLTYGSQRLCEAVRSTPSCGGAGVLMLLAILIAMIVLGATLLRLAQVPEPGSTSFLAVSLLAVLVMLFLIEATFSPAMFAVIPVLAAGCYAAAHWVTTAIAATD